jgi:hypothetical protein
MKGGWCSFCNCSSIGQVGTGGIQSLYGIIWVICCFLFLLASDTQGLQLAIRKMYEAEVHVFFFLWNPVLIVWVKIYMFIFVCWLTSWSSCGYLRALTYDVSRKQNFQMKVIFMWTINDFLVYRIVFCWSTHENLTYPYCIENNKAFTLKNYGKTSFFFIVIGGSYQRIISIEIIERTSLLAKLKRILHHYH